MQAHADWRVLNRGINGERADQIHARFAQDAAAAKPDVVVIIAGVNDTYQGPHGRDGGARAGGDVDVVFCDTRAAVAAPGGPDRLVSSPDDLHPSPDGYKLMAAALEPAIRMALAKARSLR